ncbi:MAG: YjbQ family protein [archaeon]|nr:YjbQ family protein [archaeon]
MIIKSYEFIIKSKKRNEFINISQEINIFLVKSGLKAGFCKVFIPHTTAGVTINENADPDVEKDLINILTDLIPYSKNYLHMEGNSDAHCKSSMIGSSVDVLIENSSFVLGTWQGVFFTEFDGPRTRKVILQFQGE